MARIPSDELDRLKREVDLVELVRSSGVELKGTGDNLLGLCPFHDDRSPSLVVSPAKNLWACKGACSTGGSVIDWVMRSEGVGFRHAVEILRERHGSSAVEEGFRTDASGLPSPVAFAAPDEVVLGQVVDYYHATLERDRAAQAYLARRGIADPEAVAAFKLGFSDRSLGLRLPRRNTASGAEVRDQLKRLGICRASGHEHFRGCLIIPVHDERGAVAEIYGRRIERARGGAPHLYLPGPHRGVFNLAALRSSKEIILTESLIDALTFWCAGLRHVTSSFGTNGFTDEMAEAIEAYGVERVLIAYDRDPAGDRAAARLAERLGARGVACSRVLFPRGMDANDYALKVRPAARSLAVLVRSAEHVAGPLVPPSFANRPAGRTPSEPAESCVITTPSPSLPFAAPPAAADEPRTEAPPASPAPPIARDAPEAGGVDDEVVLSLGGRRWRVRGLGRNLSFEQLRINLLLSQPGSDAFHVDTFDLYSARQRAAFLRQAAAELGVRPDALKADLGRLLLALEREQEQRIAAALEPRPAAPPMSPEDRAAAYELLRSRDLVGRIESAFAVCGLVGEETNRLLAYLAAVSRKLDRPLAVLVQSSSAAGKSALVDAVLALVPEEERVCYSAMTGQSLFYMGSSDLEHKALAIAEEEGAERASYALKLLQSEGELSIASTGKDPRTGRLVTHTYHVKGPVAILMTTTAIDLDDELLNRCLVLTVDEGRDQTRAIHSRQREEETLRGWRRRRERDRVLALHQNAQRLLRPLAVINPYAERLRFPDGSTRMRRDHQKYLCLIRAIALLHQHQREVRHDQGSPYVEVTLSDIELANRLAAEALGRTLDELPPQTRRLLELAHGWVAAECERRGIDQASLRFGRRQLSEAVGWSYSQIRKHLDRLIELEYVLVHRGGRGQSFVYELLWDGAGVEGEPFLIGLIDVESLRQAEGTTTLTPSDAGHDPSLTPACAPAEPPVTAAREDGKLSRDATSGSAGGEPPLNARRGSSTGAGSYVAGGGEMKRSAGAA